MANTPAQGCTNSTGMGSGATARPTEARDGPQEPAKAQTAVHTSTVGDVAATRRGRTARLLALIVGCTHPTLRMPRQGSTRTGSRCYPAAPVSGWAAPALLTSTRSRPLALAA